MSLGAFLAGVLLADSEFRHELEADIEPFKGLLLGLFFIAVGMSANLSLLVERPLTVAAVTLGFMALKVLGIRLIALLLRRPADTGWRVALSLMAGGEFAFVLFTLAVGQSLLEPAVGELLTLAVTLSMAVGPLLWTAFDAWHARQAEAGARPFDAIDAGAVPVIIAGFGRVGQIVGRLLRARRIAFTALDNNVGNIDFLRQFGNLVYYGDASRLDMLRAAGAEQASVFVLAIDDVEASLRTAALVQQHFPHLKLYARARNRQHAFRLMELGVTRIVRETFGSSLAMAEGVLESLGEPAPAARQAIKRFREHDEATLRRQYAMREDTNKLIATSREAARQIEQLFAADRGDGGSSATGN